MSSKSDDPDTVRSSDRRSARTGHSITRRLTLLYTLSAFSMMAIVTGVQYWLLMNEVQDDEVFLLADKARVVAVTLQVHGDDFVLLDHEVGLENEMYIADTHPVYQMRVLDEVGNVLIETPGMEEIIPTDVFSPPVDIAELYRSEISRFDAADGKTYLHLATRTTARGPGGAGRIIQAAMDDAGERAAVAAYQRNSLFALALGTSVFAVIGILITRRSLRPVKDMARAAERITAGHLSQRFDSDPDRWPLELTSLAESFSHMLQRIEEAYNRCSQCSADLAHELRTPIQNLMGEAEVTISKPRSANEYCQVLYSNIEEYRRLSGMINNLLFIARAENPRSAIERERVDVRQEVEDVLEFHEAQLQEQELVVNCSGNGHLMVDPSMLRRAISNLVSNVIYHTPKGGELSIRIHTHDSSVMTIEVADSGRGISEECLESLGDRFYRPNKFTGQAPGSGLGLAIVKSIMKLHGGTMKIHSVLDMGTTVTLDFPLPSDVESISTSLTRRDEDDDAVGSISKPLPDGVMEY